MDEELLCRLMGRIDRVITVEENVLDGGFGSAVLEVMEKRGIMNKAIKRIGIPDCFVEHGPQALIRRRYGLDPEGISARAKELFSTPRSIAHLRR